MPAAGASVPQPALLHRIPRAKLVARQTDARQGVTACAVTSAAGAREATSTSSISARPRRSAVRSAAGASGSSASPGSAVPSAAASLTETEERRRAIKGGFATRKECEAALAKVLAALETQTFTPPTKVTVKAFLTARVAAHREGQPAANDLRNLRDAHPRAHHPAPGRPAAAEAHARRDQRPLRLPRRSTAASTAAGRCRLPRCAACTPCCTRPVTTPCAGDA